MKKFSRTPAVLAAVITSLLLTALVTACHDTPGTWGHHSEGPAYTGDSGGGSSGSSTYAGNLAVNGATYTSLTMTGNSNSGTVGLGNLSGTYSNSGSSRAANTLTLSGSYTLTFSFGTITAAFSNTTVTLSAGSVSASGTGYLSTSTTPAVSTLNGMTFVNSANSSEYIVGTSDSALEWHNPPTEISSIAGGNYNSATGVLTCSYSLKQADEKLFGLVEFVTPWFEVNYGGCGAGFGIANATTLYANDARALGTFVRQ